MQTAFILVLCLLAALPAWSQPADPGAASAASADTLRLGALRTAAARQDPRAVQPDLLARATRLRLAALRAARLPQLDLSGQAAVQSEVTEIPLDVPGQDVPNLPREQFRAQVEADWTLYDGGRIARQAGVERARLAENVAGADAALYALREAATEAFFGALLFDARARALALQAEDLDARLALTRERVGGGAALAADAAVLEAELIRIRQQAEEVEADRRAALAVLADLSGRPIAPDAVLALPDLTAETARTLALADGAALGEAAAPGEALLARPELVRFARTADRLEAEARARVTQKRPQVSLFGQAGLGRPSPFNFFSDDVSEFAQAGIRLRWNLFDGGRARREAEVLRVQAQVAETEKAAFARRLAREVEEERADIAWLETALIEDERVVALREEALRVARRQLDEGILLLDTYTARLTDLTEARLTLERHRIERTQAQARLLSTLGRFPESPEPAGDVSNLD